MRSYQAPKSIWDGDKNCQHEWGSELVRKDRGVAAGSTAQVGNQIKGLSGIETRQGNFCLKCGAWQGQLGSEPSIQLFITHLVSIFEQCKRVLKPTGSLWVNLNDSMAGGKGQSGSRDSEFQEGRFEHGESLNKGYTSTGGQGLTRPTDGKIGIPAKSLCAIPERFVIAMLDSGWILRNKICWEKDSTMPESADDRFTRNWEPFFFFTLTNKTHWWVNEKTKVMVAKQPKGIHGIEGEDWHWVACPRCSMPESGPNTAENNAEPYQQNNPHILRLESHEPTGCKQCGGTGKDKKNYWSGMDYFFERQFEPLTDAYIERAKYPRNPVLAWNEDTKRYLASYLNKYVEMTINPLGRTMRSVWVINPEPQPASKKKGEVRHYAAFPTKLCTTPILACVPEQICTKCGLPRVKIYESTNSTRSAIGSASNEMENLGRLDGTAGTPEVKEVGLSDCGCGAPFVPGVVADIFGGTGTVAVEARNLGRRAVLIDVSPAYCKLAQKRLEAIPLPMELK